MPLLGDRQGVSGADAGHDSIRTIGGNDLSRRDIAVKPENTTADTADTQEPYRNTTNPRMLCRNNLQPPRLANKDSVCNGQTK